MQSVAADNPMMQMILSQVIAPFEVELGHGPLLTLNGFGVGSYAVKATLDPATEWVQLAMTNLDVPYVFQLRGQTGFGSGFTFDGDIPSFETDMQGQTVSFSGLTFTGHTTGRGTTFETNSDRLALQSTFMNLTLEGLGLAGDFARASGGMSLGTGKLSVGRFVAINPLLGTQEVIALNGIGVSATTALNDAGNIDYGIVYEAGSMQIQTSPNLADVAIGITLLNLDYAAFEQLSQVAAQSSFGDSSSLAMQMLPLLDQIVAAGPGLALDPVRLSMDGGQLSGRLNASIDPAAMPTGRSGQVMDLMDPNVLIAAVRADLELTAAKAMLINLIAMNIQPQLAFAMPTATETQLATVARQQAEQTIQGIVAQGMVADAGDNYSTTIVLENGIATVNGMPIPLASLGLF
jgi:uncharacterized protein YdgA (DUF945 family)